MRKGVAETAFALAAEHILASAGMQQALVDMHRTARLGFHGFCQKRGVHAMPQRGLAHGALEHEDLIGARQRIGMGEVDLQLRRAGFVDQGIHVQFHRIAVVVHQIQDRVELVDRIDRIRLPRGFRAAGAPSPAAVTGNPGRCSSAPERIPAPAPPLVAASPRHTRPARGAARCVAPVRAAARPWCSNRG